MYASSTEARKSGRSVFRSVSLCNIVCGLFCFVVATVACMAAAGLNLLNVPPDSLSTNWSHQYMSTTLWFCRLAHEAVLSVCVGVDVYTKVYVSVTANSILLKLIYCRR